MLLKRYALFLCACLGLLALGRAFAHCQVPCGIYDDDARFAALAEDITTIEKALAQIKALAPKQNDPLNAQQLHRWAEAKDQHADSFAHTLGYYFLQQRIKAPAAGQDETRYVAQLKAVHGLLVAAMKAKQGVDAQPVADLRSGLATFQALYQAGLEKK